MISISNLKKKFKEHVAVNGVNLEIEPNRCIGIVGPTGSGKSTTLKMVSGLQYPDSGNIMAYEGIQFGYSGDKFDVDVSVSGIDYLKTIGEITSTHSVDSITELISLFRMNDILSKKIKTYSTGMRKKLGILQAFAGNPDVVVLDEPFESLDPVDRYQLVNFIKEYIETGNSVLLASHILYEMNECCSSIYFMKTGVLVLEYQIDRRGQVVFLETKTKDMMSDLLHDNENGMDVSMLYRKVYA